MKFDFIWLWRWFAFALIHQQLVWLCVYFLLKATNNQTDCVWLFSEEHQQQNFVHKQSNFFFQQKNKISPNKLKEKRKKIIRKLSKKIYFLCVFACVCVCVCVYKIRKKNHLNERSLIDDYWFVLDWIGLDCVWWQWVRLLRN